jgi:YggT family protein
MAVFIVNFINTLAALLSLLMLIYVLASWVFPPYHNVYRALAAICDPLLAPIRRLLPPVGGLDFSPFIFLVLVNLLAAILAGLIH